MIHFDFFYSERTEKLHSMLINCGRQITRSHDYIWHGLKRGNREFVIWQYTIAGMGALDLKGETHYIYPGQAFLLIVPEDHCYYLPRESDSWTFMYVTVYGSELIRLARDFRRGQGVVKSYSEDSPVLANAEDLLAVAHNKQITDRYIASSLAYSFGMALMAEPAGREQDENYRVISKIHQYCVQNVGKNITVDDMADFAGFSRWHFSRIFQKLEGMPPHKFMLDLKMRLAVRLLQTTDKSIKEIANSCGFEDISYFCKVFRNHHHISPGNFRHNQEPEP